MLLVVSKSMLFDYGHIQDFTFTSKSSTLYIGDMIFVGMELNVYVQLWPRKLTTIQMLSKQEKQNLNTQFLYNYTKHLIFEKVATTKIFQNYQTTNCLQVLKFALMLIRPT